MPKTNSTKKAVRSFRLSKEGIWQLRSMATSMGRSESDVIEIALDRMYREEFRYNRMLRDGSDGESHYQVDENKEEQHDRDDL